MEDLVVNEAVVIPARELSWTATASGGPGGQHVNKVATKVFLRWDLGQSQTLATSLPSWVDARLRSLAARRINGEGILEVSCDATRSQSRNLEIARARLVDLVRAALDRPKRRRATQPSRAAVARRLDDKRKQSRKKAERRADID